MRPLIRLLSVRLLSTFAVLVLLAACATAPRIQAEADPGADFSRYRSYAFFEPLAMEQSGYSTYLTTRIRTAIQREMDARGYRYDEAGPDLLVNFQGFIRERTDVYSVPRSNVDFYYSYWSRSYVAVPIWYDETRISQYTEGTLSVDLVDAARNHLVWTGAAIGRVNQRTAQERVAAAEQSIAAIFMKYPHAAGSE